MGFSAINVPGQEGTFKKVISGDVIYYVRANGLDSNTGLAASGSGDGPFLTVDKAIQTINASAIAPGAIVTIDIGECSYFGAGEFRSGSLLINHPNADRIVIQGAEPTSIPVNSIRTYGQNSAVTGGYFMEVNLESLPTGMTMGDILVIEEPNYFSNTTSPIIYENDFQATKMAVVDNEQGVKDHAHNVNNNATLGLTFEPFDATPRKFLACGAHEVAECRTAGTANYALLFVRHTNPYIGFTASSEPRNAFVNPAGIRLTSTGDLEYHSMAQNYNEEHLLRYSAGALGVTGSSGFTSDGHNYEEYLTANRQRSVNLRAKLYRTRLNFDTTDGLNIQTNLRELKNIAILGPAHNSTLGSGITYDLRNRATNKGIAVRGSERGAGYGSTMFTNVAVSGFEYGVDLENAGLSADNLYCSSNQVGLRSNQNTFADINHGVFTGNIDGIQTQNGGSVLLERSFSAANERHGARVRGDLVAKASSFCLNGNRGVDIERGSFHVISPTGITGPGDDIAGATQYGGVTSDHLYVTEVERFDKSNRDGAFIFHNFGEGVYGSQADIVLNSAVVSYNGKGNTYANLRVRNGSRVKTEFSNFWASGVTLHNTRSSEQSSVYIQSSDAEIVSSQAGESHVGIVGVDGSRVTVTNSIANGNTFDQYFVRTDTSLRWDGSTAAHVANTNAVHVGVRLDGNSTGLLVNGGISGGNIGIKAENHSAVLQSLTNTASTGSATASDGDVDAGTGVL